MIANQDLDAMVAATFVQFLDPSLEDAHMRTAAQRLSHCSDSKKLFEHCYATHDKFCFAEDYQSSRLVEWLGSATTEVIADGLSVTMHHVLVEDNFHGTRSLHQHVAFHQPILFGDTAMEGVRRIVRALHAMYWSTEYQIADVNWVRRLDPFMDMYKTNTTPITASRHLYTSVILPHESERTLANWREMAGAIYSLLFLHKEGVEPTVALESLEGSEWKSTNFFVLFSQPDGVLSLAVPYPAPGVTEPWPFVLARTNVEARSNHAKWLSRIQELEHQFEPYDLLPEFPCLRYNAMALLEYVGTAEFEQRRIRRRLDDIGQMGWWKGLIAGVKNYRRLNRSYYRTTTPLVIRLPVVRQKAEKLLRERTLALNEKVIDSMRAGLITDLIMVLTALGLIVAFIQLFVAVVAYSGPTSTTLSDGTGLLSPGSQQHKVERGPAD